ncbi:zf-HC2 domain-containing protein [Desulfococcaceae bacterium HSG8]|nr:zf-HC2 domain-containing protein [Desulfococcaceae bacterium HSG8]
MKKRCPDDEMLADYMEGRVSAEKRLEMEAHLSNCDSCLEVFLANKSLARDIGRFEAQPAPNQVTQAAVYLVTELNVSPYELFRNSAGKAVRDMFSKLSDYLTPDTFNRPALMPIRGDGKTVSEDCVKKRFKGMDAEIEIEKTGKENVNIRVSLDDSAKENRDVRVTLTKDGREVSSFLMEQGYVLFEDVPRDHYTLILSGQGESIGTYSFEINK